VCPHCTDDARFVGHRSRAILTVCGHAEITRAYYHCDSCRTGHSPADDALRLDGRYSPGVQPLVALAGVLEPFRRAEQLLEELAGLRVSKEACRVFTEGAGERLERQHLAHHPVGAVGTPKPWDFSLPPRDGKRFGGTVAYVGLDAFAVPTIGGDGKREWKMWNVGLLYDPHKKHTIDRTGFDQKGVAQRLRDYAIAFDLGRADRVVALTDGGAGLESALSSHFGAWVTFVLDFWHASEHLHGMSRVWHGDGAVAASWAEQAVGVMRESGGAGLMAWLATHGPGAEASEPVREAWRLLSGYVEGNVHRMDYPEYRTRGWDIGSGPTEAGCKIVGGRLRGAGMRWWKPQSARIAELRALLLSNEGLWEGFWNNPRQQAA
jgi:hypothetical protein